MSPPPDRPLLVWDLPLRLFHWSLVICFVGAWLSAESERWKLWHVSFGYSMGLLLVWRLMWGVAGSRYARFSQFVTGPAAVKAYLLSYIERRPQQHIGHNPAGAWAIVAILATILLTVVSGYFIYERDAGEWVANLHELVADSLMGLVGLHVSAVLLMALVYKKNLVLPMLSGKKSVAPSEAITPPHIAQALLLFGALAILWWRMFS